MDGRVVVPVGITGFFCDPGVSEAERDSLVPRGKAFSEVPPDTLGEGFARFGERCNADSTCSGISVPAEDVFSVIVSTRDLFLLVAGESVP